LFNTLKVLEYGLGGYISLCVKSVRVGSSTDLSLNDALTSFNCNATNLRRKPLWKQGLFAFSYI